MEITNESTDEMILAEMGGRLVRVRLAKNLTQAQLAERAGVSKRTVERLESGGVAPQLSGFIRICRALDFGERFGLLVPEREMKDGTTAAADTAGRVRRRASAARGVRRAGDEAAERKKVGGQEAKAELEGETRVVVAIAEEQVARSSVVVVAHELN